ncbi:integrase core domain-containing protein [Porphyromonas macacae]|uniref:integrase core domain-containing protein n=1 Tax=Porphyromonas macacae TaxID=28115 RepID=UPI0009DA6013
MSHEQQSFREAELSVEGAIRMYNRARPHQALGAKTPMQILDSKAQNPLLTPEEELPRIAPGLYRKMNALKRRHSVGVNPKPS